MNYEQNLAQLAEYGGNPGYTQDPQFLSSLAAFIFSAENLIFRDLDLLSTRAEDPSGALSANRRQFVLPTTIGTFIVLETVRLVIDNIIQPPLTWVSHDALEAIWPDDHAAGIPSIPTKIAPRDQASVNVGPAPDQPYGVVCFGTMRPQPLYAGAAIDFTTTPPAIAIAANSPADIGTFVSTQLPDLFLAAEMISVSAYQRNFGTMVEDPAQALSWSGEYERLKSAALVEEFRKKFQMDGGNRLRMPAPPRAA